MKPGIGKGIMATAWDTDGWDRYIWRWTMNYLSRCATHIDGPSIFDPVTLIPTLSASI
jgi:hypothetical protein